MRVTIHHERLARRRDRGSGPAEAFSGGGAESLRFGEMPPVGSSRQPPEKTFKSVTSRQRPEKTFKGVTSRQPPREDVLERCFAAAPGEEVLRRC